jgi:hypothetical protein
MPVEGGQGKVVWKSGVAPRPLCLGILERLQARCPTRVQLFEEFQRVLQIREFVHQVDLR